MYPNISYFLHDVIGTSPDNWTSIFKTYGIFLFLGIFIASKVFEHEVKKNLGILLEEEKRKALPSNFRNNVLFIVAISGMVGSKVIVLIEEYEVFFNYSVFDAIFRETGISFYGGLLGAALALIIYFRRVELKILPTLDAAAPALLIGYSIGRLGCHFSGDGDWGVMSPARPTWWFAPDWAWGYNFPHNVANRDKWIEGCAYEYCKILEQPVFPTSLYEAAACFLLFLFLVGLRKLISRPHGVIFYSYLIMSGTERFLTEFIRVNKKYHFGDYWFSQAQFISLTLIVLGFALLCFQFYTFRKENRPI